VTETVPYWEARARALARCLDADPSVVIIGHATSAPYNSDDGIRDRYPDRFLTPPISEFAVLSASVGAASAGLRPCVFLGTSTFMYYGWSAFVNEAPHVRYLSGGQVSAPAVLHVLAGARRAGGVQHEHTPQSMLQGIPGLRLYTPATPQSIYDVVVAALTGDDPVVIADHVLLGETEGPLDEAASTQTGPLELLRSGDDGLIVGSSLMSQRSLEAADSLADGESLSLTVANLVTLSPSPWAEVAELAERHPFTVFVDEARGPGSPASYVMSRVAEQLPGERLRLLCASETFYPFAPALLDEVVPTVGRIRDTVLAFAAQPR
jgi:pyruvate dehydrogenase E1 component beta subunit